MQILTIRKHKVLLDDADFERLKGFKWYLGRGRYAYVVRNTPNRGGNVFMHWDVIGRPPPGLVTDHIDGNRFNNQRSNLRHCTIRENILNRGPYGAVNLPGVCQHQTSYQAAVTIEGESVYIGRYDTPEQAHAAWLSVPFIVRLLAFNNLLAEGKLRLSPAGAYYTP